MHSAKSEHVQGDMTRFLAPQSKGFQKQCGDNGGDAAGVNVTLGIQGIQAPPPPNNWRPPQGASAPEPLVADERGED